MSIRILSDETASRIAAGEVVERPASVVKELIENSLDAGASEIFVWVEKSGTLVIRVSDNGVGMVAQDLDLAVERHATSKLDDEADLLCIATLGFRGEALPSIASVSLMEIVTRNANSLNGCKLKVVGGKKEQVHAAPAAIGTTIEIKDIFFNTPARRKFLKSPATELSHICDVFNRMALINPGIHFRLQHDGRTVADYVAVEEAKDRLRQVLGREMSAGLRPFDSRLNETGVSGFVSLAPTSFPNARYLYTFVNGRYVRDKVLTHAVLQAYDTLLMKGQYPAVVMLLQLPFEDVDVNVHPAKYDVRFRRQSDVHQAISRGIREALRIEAKEPLAGTHSPAPMAYLGVRDAGLFYGTSTSVQSINSAERAGGFSLPVHLNGQPDGGFFSSLHILGQILGCYLVCVSSDGLALLDQHAAHERVAFERLRRQLDQGVVQGQTLLIPQSVPLTAGEMMLVERKLPLLKQYGFVLEPFGPDAYAITAAPALLPEGDYSQIIRQIVCELADVDISAKMRQHLEDRLATIACHSVIRANRQLEMAEMRALLWDLDQIEFATQCPHGRPVLLKFGRDDLERMFKRVV